MKYILSLAAAAALLAGCASQGGTGTGSTSTGDANSGMTMAPPGDGPGTPELPFASPGNDRNDTGTTSGTGVSDLGAASPSDQQQREPYDPRLHRR